ncbi:hypothetical protein L596_010833 [Steinernema carpocapsae]|uniref:Uncharacterized protein n=1 Tax=Steinernema carpocapsae TaxID=34508 RepID=A0A4U5PJJ0_STECR|nr:hypothetical protein L596_010833 [Steinernema carpocapsae]
MVNRNLGPKPLDFSRARSVKKYLLAESCGGASPLPFVPKSARIGCVTCVLVSLRAGGPLESSCFLLDGSFISLLIVDPNEMVIEPENRD